MTEEMRLPWLVRQLERRYSGIRVEAWLKEHDRGRGQVRTIIFKGARPLLREYGLLPPATNYVDQWGTDIACQELKFGWGEGNVGTVCHHHYVHAGAPTGLWHGQHPENAKTRALVAKFLARIAKGVTRG